MPETGSSKLRLRTQPVARVRWAELRLFAGAAFLTLFLNACMLGPDYRTPKSDLDAQWPEASAKSEPAAGAVDAYWWKSMKDPALDGLIEAAFGNNPTLQIAGVRVLEARAQLNQSIGNLFPQQQALSGGATYTDTTLKSDSAPLVPGGINPNYASAQLAFSASWELDFWGKYRRSIESQRAAFLGTVASYDDALVTLIADVASSYVNIRATEERLRVASRNADIQRESLRVAGAQYKYGETSELDVRQATTILEQTEAQIPRLQNTLNQARTGLAVLLGIAPGRLDTYLKGPGEIPAPPEQIAVGIPKDLLRRRPDVRAAGLSAAAQSALIGVAKANMYPALSLSGMFGYSSNNLGAIRSGTCSPGRARPVRSAHPLYGRFSTMAGWSTRCASRMRISSRRSSTTRTRCSTRRLKWRTASRRSIPNNRRLRT